jgi:glycosyltransferase involved in cell wall biosynthesis
MTRMPILVQTIKGCCIEVPILSVVIPVFNQEQRIEIVIQSLLANLSVPSELIIIDDASTDKSLTVLSEVLSRIIPFSRNLVQARLYSFESSVFETQCDCFGIENAVADYVLELQADMYINEPCFDRKMIDAIKKYPDIFMLSGRGTEKIFPIHQLYLNGLGAEGCHRSSLFLHAVARILKRFRIIRTFLQRRSVEIELKVQRSSSEDISGIIYPDLATFKMSGCAGRLSELIEENIVAKKEYLWLSESIMRGPLLIDRKKYDEVGGFDKYKFYQGYDDHDLAIRGWDLCGYRTAFIPIYFASPIEAGTGIRKKSLLQELEIFKNLWRINTVRKKSTLYRAQEILCKKPLQPEIRNL